MLTIGKTILPFFLFIAVLQQTVYGQTNCKDIDLNKVPGKWNWTYQGINRPVAKQIWNICDPISKDFQRIMPKAPDGIIAYSLMTGGEAGTFYNLPRGPLHYQNYFMIKDYECIMYPNAKVQPEGETGCWIYFDVNNHNGYGAKLPGESDVMFDDYRRLYLTSAWLESDANGNQLLYTSTEKGRVVKQGFVFTEKKRIPYRKITRKELFNCYKFFQEQRVRKEIDRFEKIVIKNDQQYNGLTAAQKKEQNYWPDIIKRDKDVLQGYKTEKEKIEQWYIIAMQQPNLNDTAFAKQIASWAFEPEKLDAAYGEGNPVWIDDIDFYDRTKPVSQPQYIFMWYRLQDESLPKKNFMEKFTNTFNLDVLWKMIGAAPRKPGGANTILSSYTNAKTNTRTQQQNSRSVLLNFNNTSENQFPDGWMGMKNIVVNTIDGAKSLAMTKDSYWYPRQFNKEITDGFELSFDLKWNPDISYYSGLFTVTIGEIEYDNAGERYRDDDNQTMYASMYDSYGANFNRVILWFDPYWNGGGRLTVYSYYAGGALAVNKQIVLPDFLQAKKDHHITLQRKGNNLSVIDNDKLIADVKDVFLAGARYNLYTFSRYKGNNSDNKNDVFYLNNINIAY